MVYPSKEIPPWAHFKVLCATVFGARPLVSWEDSGGGGSNGAAGSLAVLAVLPQSSAAHGCCVVTSLLRQAWSEGNGEMWSSATGKSVLIIIIIIIILLDEGSYLRFSLLGLKPWKLCLARVWIGMKPCLFSFSGAESAWDMKWERACLRESLTGKQDGKDF